MSWAWTPLDEEPGYDALMIWEPGGVMDATLAGNDGLVLIARFGMGLGAIDLDACAQRGVIVTTTPDAVRDAVPSGAMAFVLSVAHGLPAKDGLVRSGRWNERFEHIGAGTGGRTIGIIGLETSATPWPGWPIGLRRLAFDPDIDPGSVRAGIELVPLASLLQRSDFVGVTCPLTPSTHQLLDRSRLALMRPDASVINVARGPIVDTLALAEALRAGDTWLGDSAAPEAADQRNPAHAARRSPCGSATTRGLSSKTITSREEPS